MKPLYTSKLPTFFSRVQSDKFPGSCFLCLLPIGFSPCPISSVPAQSEIPCLLHKQSLDFFQDLPYMSHNIQDHPIPYQNFPLSQIYPQTPGLLQKAHPVHHPSLLCTPDFIPFKPFPMQAYFFKTYLLLAHPAVCVRLLTNKRSQHAQISSQKYQQSKRSSQYLPTKSYQSCRNVCHLDEPRDTDLKENL